METEKKEFRILGMLPARVVGIVATLVMLIAGVGTLINGIQYLFGHKDLTVVYNWGAAAAIALAVLVLAIHVEGKQEERILRRDWKW